jgi:tRNA threonylcarbamoyl adenosine modification protein YjeE
MIKTYNIDREQDTIRLARRIAPLIGKGDVLALYGDLGSGKTFFTRHLCQALGVAEPVTSPSFVLVNQYRAPDFQINHIDLFRLQSESDLWGLGIEEFIEDGVTIIEWPQLAERMFDDRTLRLTFDYTPEARTLTLAVKEAPLCSL